MQKLRMVLAVFALLMLIYLSAYVLDYNNLSLRKNIGTYAGIFTMICMIFAMLGSYKWKQKSQNEVEQNESGTLPD